MSRGPKQVFLHVGLPKTGTTFLQAVLAASRDRLEDAGICYPGMGTAHFLAAQDLTQHLFMGRPDPRVAGSWSKVVRQAKRAKTNGVVISHELFTMAQPDQIARARDDLSPATLHVVLTVRDFERQIPAVWQERLKNGGTVSFARHLAQAQEASARRGDASVGFWKQQDAVAILNRWQTALPKERVHVIIVPPRGAPKDLLWRRFAEVISVPPDIVDLTLTTPRDNVSIRPPTAKVLRSVNRRLHETLPPTTHRDVVKRYLTQTVGDVGQSATNYSMTAEQLDQAAAWSNELSTYLRDSELDVIGDLSELLPSHSNLESVEANALDDVPDDEAASAAVATTAALLRWLATPTTATTPPD